MSEKLEVVRSGDGWCTKGAWFDNEPDAHLFAAAQMMRDEVQSVIDKCMQYWNAHNINDEEIHCALEWIVRRLQAARVATWPPGGTT